MIDICSIPLDMDIVTSTIVMVCVYLSTCIVVRPAARRMSKPLLWMVHRFPRELKDTNMDDLLAWRDAEITVHVMVVMAYSLILTVLWSLFVLMLRVNPEGSRMFDVNPWIPYGWRSLLGMHMVTSGMVAAMMFRPLDFTLWYLSTRYRDNNSVLYSRCSSVGIGCKTVVVALCILKLPIGAVTGMMFCINYYDPWAGRLPAIPIIENVTRYMISPRTHTVIFGSIRLPVLLFLQLFASRTFAKGSRTFYLCPDDVWWQLCVLFILAIITTTMYKQSK